MSDLEFDVLDEMYFVVSFDELMDKTDLEDHELKKILNKLLQKRWIKCLSSATEDVLEEDLNFDRDARRYFYLATKTGLMAHNSNG